MIAWHLMPIKSGQVLVHTYNRRPSFREIEKQWNWIEDSIKFFQHKHGLQPRWEIWQITGNVKSHSLPNTYWKNWLQVSQYHPNETQQKIYTWMLGGCWTNEWLYRWMKRKISRWQTDGWEIKHRWMDRKKYTDREKHNHTFMPSSV